MDPSEVEFVAEKEKISILTNFSENKIYLIGVSFVCRFCGYYVSLLLWYRVSGVLVCTPVKDRIAVFQFRGT